MLKSIKLIVAFDSKGGISRKGKIPWYFKDDMSRFRSKSTGNGNNCVIYGKQTFLDLKKPLPNRHNIVISSTLVKNENANNSYSICKTIKEGIEEANSMPNIENIFICGGSGIYKEAIETLDIDDLYLTRINNDYDCDNFFPLGLINLDKYKIVNQVANENGLFEFIDVTKK